MDFNVVLDSLVAIWETLASVAPDAWGPALIISALVGALKWRNLLSTPDQVRAAVVFLSSVAGGGVFGRLDTEDGVMMALVAIFASLFHAIFESYIAPLGAKIVAGGSSS